MSGNDTGADGSRAVEGIRVLDRLHAEGRIARETRDRIVAEASRSRDNALDLLVDYGIVPEAELLRFLATMYQTQFVSTDKLAKAAVDRAVLETVPARVAERLVCFPVLFDARTGTLSVVGADLEQHDVAKNLSLITQARQVKCYVARPRAVRAAIRRGYYGDARAFEALLTVAYAPEPWAAAQDAAPAANPVGDVASQPSPASSQLPSIELADGLDDLAVAPTAKVPLPPLPAALGSTPAGPPGVSAETFRETVGVLVALLDQGRDDLRGHSAEVARVARALASRLGLDEVAGNDVAIAGHLHDLGKGGLYHLTALNVAHWEGHRAQAEKLHAAPLELLAGAKLASGTLEALASLYERYDGRGFPRGASGEGIPIGARILAVAETYVDVTTNAKNPYRRKLTSEEACEGLSKLRGSVFDPRVVDALKAVASGAFDEDAPRVLLVDPDGAQTAPLEVHLVDRGFRVQVVRDAEAALAAARSCDVVVSEVDLGASDGFELLERLKRAGSAVPFVFLARRADQKSVGRGIELGAADYLVKPVLPDVVVAKVKKALSDGARGAGPVRGFAGSLAEMGLPDVVQILANGRKSGRLVIRASGKSGDVGFRDGRIFEASFGGLEGARAFHAMLLATDGDFALDTSYVPERDLVQQSTEGLLLEGMRLLDESNR